MKSICICWRLLLGLCLLIPAQGWASISQTASLGSRYNEVMHGHQTRVFGAPVFVDSGVGTEQLRADVYGVIEQPFTEVSAALTGPANWCEFVPLSLNIKSCTHQQSDGHHWLTFYAGRKHYQKPEQAYPLQYQYQLQNVGADYLNIVLSANEGPFGTRNFRIELEAMSIDGKTLIHLHSSYQASLISRMATHSYLATLGRHKVGFSIVDTLPTGQPVYVGGMKGIIERNAMRYYLALKAYLDTRQLPASERFEARVRTWFLQTEAHPLQLHEVEWHEYVTAKRREREHQLQLQRQLGAASMPCGQPQKTC